MAESQSKCRVPAELEKYLTEKVETGVAESHSQYSVPGPAREIPLREGSDWSGRVRVSIEFQTQLERYLSEKVETGLAESQSQYRVPGPAREIPLRERRLRLGMAKCQSK